VKYNRNQSSFINTNKKDYRIDFEIPNVDAKFENSCVPVKSLEIDRKRGLSSTLEYFEKASGYVIGKGSEFSNESYVEYMYSIHCDVEKMGHLEYGNLFDPTYMQNAAKKGEIFHIHYKGHVDNVRYLDVYTNAPHLNKIIVGQSNYNFLNSSYKKFTILNIFRLF